MVPVKKMCLALVLMIILPSAFAVTISGRFIDGETGQPVANVGLIERTSMESFPEIKDDVLLGISNTQGEFVISPQVPEVVAENLTIAEAKTQVQQAESRGVDLGSNNVIDSQHANLVTIVPDIYTANPNITVNQTEFYWLSNSENAPRENKTVTEYGFIENYSSYYWTFNTVPGAEYAVLLESHSGIGNMLTDINPISQGVKINDGNQYIDLGNITLYSENEWNFCTAANLVPGTSNHYMDAGNCNITVYPNKGMAYTPINLIGTGYYPDEKYILSFGGQAFEDVYSDANGTINRTFRITDEFQNNPSCGASTTCGFSIGITTPYGEELRNVVYQLTENLSGTYFYVGRAGNITVNLFEFNQTVPVWVPLELTATNQGKTCTFLVNGTDSLTLRTGSIGEKDNLQFEVFNIMTLPTGEKVCRATVVMSSQSIFVKILVWVRNLLS